MMLGELLEQIRRTPGPVTTVELARRLGVTPVEITGMLAALRASGMLAPDRVAEPGTEECASAGSCAAVCPGPSRCPFTVELGGTLEIRRG